MIRLIVAGPDALTRALVLTVLQDIPELSVDSWDGDQDVSSLPPDGIILHDANDAASADWLYDHLSAVERRWPANRVIVLTPHLQRSLALCRSHGVCGFVATSIDVERLVAVIKLVHAGYVVYPDDMPGALERGRDQPDRQRFGETNAGSPG